LATRSLSKGLDRPLDETRPKLVGGDREKEIERLRNDYDSGGANIALRHIFVLLKTRSDLKPRELLILCCKREACTTIDDDAAGQRARFDVENVWVG
jgi:hypothetical protein